MDDDSTGQLLDVAAGRLAAYGYLLTGSQRAGEDLVQDAIVKVFARRRRLDGVPVAEAHVRAAMRQLHLDEVCRPTWWRAFLRWLVPPPPAAYRTPEPVSGDPTGRAMAILSPMERAAVMLRHHEHLQIPEMAVAMRVDEATVERHLAEALAKLSRILGEIEPEFDQVLIVDRTRR
jgi:DNA-directed RNA polymerase specialized sigma24 family protein